MSLTTAQTSMQKNKVVRDIIPWRFQADFDSNHENTSQKLKCNNKAFPPVINSALLGGGGEG